jgi:hypothetical protein
MNIAVEKKFSIEIVYNGVTKPFQVEPEEQVSALLHKAIAAFGITQNPHLLSLFRQDGSVIPENESVERAGLKPKEVLLLRPNAVKGGAGLLHVATNIVAATFRKLRECGDERFECVVYWIGAAEDPVVDGIEHPIHMRLPCCFVVDDAWLTDFWKRLAALRRSVKVQIHTHPGPAFHSTTDDTWPIVSQAGFLSIVIPDFAVGTPSLDRAWVGRLRTDGKWEQLDSAMEVICLA